MSVATVPARPSQSPIPGSRLLAVEARKLIDSPAMIILLLTAVLLAGVTGGGAVLLRPDVTFAGVVTMSLLAAPYLLAVLGILLVTGESSQRTALSTCLLVPRRGRVLTAKAMAVAGLGLAAGLLALPAGVLISLVGGALTGRGIRWDFSWSAYGWLVLGMIAVALIGWALGSAFDNAPAAISVLLVWSMLSRLIAGASATLTAVMPWVQWDTIFTLGNDSAGIDFARAGVSLLVWLVLPAIIGRVRHLRREIR